MFSNFAYAVVIAGSVFVEVPDLESCKAVRAMVLMDMRAQIVNFVSYHANDLVKMVTCERVNKA